MNKDLQDFIEKTKNTYQTIIEQAESKRKVLLIQIAEQDEQISKTKELMNQLKEDEEKWKS